MHEKTPVAIAFLAKAFHLVFVYQLTEPLFSLASASPMASIPVFARLIKLRRVYPFKSQSIFTDGKGVTIDHMIRAADPALRHALKFRGNEHQQKEEGRCHSAIPN